MSTHWTTCIVILILGFSAGYFAGTSHDQESTEIAIPSSGAAYDPSPQNPPSQTPKPKTLESSPQAIPELDAEPTPMVITASLYPVFSERDLEVVFDQLEEEQDLPALIDVILGLIQQRRFSEADRLIDSTIAGLNGGKLNSPLWKNSGSPEFSVMRFCQSPQNYQASLEYALHVFQLTSPPELLGDLREEIFHSESLVRFLAINDGAADLLIADFVPIFRDRIENWDRTLFTKRSVVQGLGLIPTAESAFLIADLREWTSKKLELELIQALSTNGTPMAVDIMSAWLAEERNPRFKLALEDALRLLN